MRPDLPLPLVAACGDLDERRIHWIRDDEIARATKRIPARYRDATITVPEVEEWVAELVAKAVEDRGKRDPIVQEGRSLLIAGSSGCGKTHAAYGAIWALAASGVRCSWRAITVADAFDLLRPSPGVDTRVEFDALARTGVLVLDDIGAAKISEWTEEILYRLINQRYEHIAPTIITTNLTRLAPTVGDRVASRFAEMCTQVTISGPDRRRLKN